MRAAKSPKTSGAGRHLRTAIDPEALLLVSLALIPGELRLADLLHDWGARNSELLSVQRVKNLAREWPRAARTVMEGQLAWFATVARDEGKDLRWRSVESSATESGGKAIEPGESLRPGKSRATRARLVDPATLPLRLRLGFGVGVKADLLAFLLASWGTWEIVRDIADATAYTPAAVRRAAEDLAAARLIHMSEGSPTSFRVEQAAWEPLLAFQGRPLRWGSWRERFLFTVALLEWETSARERPLSAYALGAHGRELLDRYRTAFERDHVAVWSSHSPVQDWTTFFHQSVGSLATWMREMA